MCHPCEQVLDKQKKIPTVNTIIDTIKTSSTTHTSFGRPGEQNLDTSTELVNIYRSNKGRPIRSNFPTADFAAPPGFNKTSPPVKLRRKAQKPASINLNIKLPAAHASSRASRTTPIILPAQVHSSLLPSGTRTHPIDITDPASSHITLPPMSTLFQQAQAALQFPNPRTLPSFVNTTRSRLGGSYASLPHRFGGLHLARGRKKASSQSRELTLHESFLVKELDIWRRRHYRKWNRYGRLKGEEEGEGRRGPKLRPILVESGWGRDDEWEEVKKEIMVEDEGTEEDWRNRGLPGLRAVLEGGEGGQCVEEFCVGTVARWE